MRFTDAFLSTLRDRVPLSDLIGRRVSFDKRKSRPAKGDHWACCPFHSEKTPSFHVDDRKGRYHCFGCQASGDHFRFLMEIDGLTFPEAVERVAGEAGVSLPAPDPEAARRQAATIKLHDVLELAAQFFERQLQSDAGREALAYAERRGLDAETRKTFRVGFAPDRRDALIGFLSARSVPIADMIETGLVIQPDDASRAPYDRFRGRLMVAIETAQGRVVGFGGRVLGKGEPKYLNSPETEFFRKREMLFNAQRAREAAHRSGRLLLVEGYMDAIALHRAGFAEAVASLGTAVGDEQLNLMWRFADEPIVCLDGDEAGLRAAYRTMDRVLPLLKPGKSLRFLYLPEGQDPDDFLSENGTGAFEALLEGAQPLIEALWAREISQADVSTPERMAALQARLSRLAGTIADGTVKAHYDQALRDRFYAYRRSLRGSGGAAGPRSDLSPRGTAPQGVHLRRAPEPVSVERQLLALARHFPDAARVFADRDVYPLCRDEALARQLDDILQGGQAEASEAADQQSLDALPFPVLRLDVTPRFLSMLFTFLFAQLEFRSVSDDAERERSSGDDALSDGAMERVLALQDEARAMRTRLHELEAQLDEEATVLRAVSHQST
ncbi:MAG: DNA primase [Devosiaceae bacterium]|nr:DNA primase [Devosiaceae bacterium MH13]